MLVSTIDVIMERPIKLSSGCVWDPCTVGTQHVACSERFRLQTYCTLTRFWCDGYGGSSSEGRQVAAAIEVIQITNMHRGRDGHCWPPPAQIRTCRTTAYGSYLG